MPYITERFSGAVQGRAMGAYTSSLVLGGFVGRVGTAWSPSWTDWRLALSLLAVPAALGALAMWRWLPRDAVDAVAAAAVAAPSARTSTTARCC